MACDIAGHKMHLLSFVMFFGRMNRNRKCLVLTPHFTARRSYNLLYSYFRESLHWNKCQSEQQAKNMWLTNITGTSTLNFIRRKYNLILISIQNASAIVPVCVHGAECSPVCTLHTTLTYLYPLCTWEWSQICCTHIVIQYYSWYVPSSLCTNRWHTHTHSLPCNPRSSIIVRT